MRYKEPRKLETKRGRKKAEQNAWCFTCRRPMAKHGPSFHCSDCHISTRIELSGENTSSVTRIPKASRLPEYRPWCVQCRVQMARFARESTRPDSYRCRRCRAMAASHIDSSAAVDKQEKILEMIKAGHLDKQIVRKLHCHHRTVARLRLQVSDPRKCECGQLLHHTKKCHKRPGWQTLARDQRSVFEDLIVRINRRVPLALPEEMRADICQEMLLEVVKATDAVLARAPQFIRDYKKKYPFQYHSFDANPRLVDRIAG